MIERLKILHWTIATNKEPFFCIFNFLKEIKSWIHEWHIKLIKCDSKYIYNVKKYLFQIDCFLNFLLIKES